MEERPSDLCQTTEWLKLVDQTGETYITRIFNGSLRTVEELNDIPKLRTLLKSLIENKLTWLECGFDGFELSFHYDSYRKYWTIKITKPANLLSSLSHLFLKEVAK